HRRAAIDAVRPPSTGRSLDSAVNRATVPLHSCKPTLKGNVDHGLHRFLHSASGHFVRHYVEMVIAMFLGMLLLGVPAEGALVAMLLRRDEYTGHAHHTAREQFA